MDPARGPKIKKIEDGSSMYGKKHGGSMSHGKKDGMSMYGKKHGGSMYGKKNGGVIVDEQENGTVRIAVRNMWKVFGAEAQSIPDQDWVHNKHSHRRLAP